MRYALLSCLLFASPAYALQSTMTLIPVEGKAHVAELCMFNAFTKDPNVRVYTFKIDLEPVIVQHRSYPRSPDYLTVVQLPVHLEAETMKLEINENQEGCIKIFPRLMG